MLHVSLVEVDDDDDVALFGVSEELLVSETKSFGDGGVILEKGMVESFAVVVHEEEVQVASHDRTFIAGLEIERERERVETGKRKLNGTVSEVIYRKIK